MWHDISMWNRIFKKKQDFCASSYYILMIDYKVRERDRAQHNQKYVFRNGVMFDFTLTSYICLRLPHPLWCSSTTHQVCNTSSGLILLNQVNYWEAVTLETHTGPYVVWAFMLCVTRTRCRWTKCLGPLKPL